MNTRRNDVNPGIAHCRHTGVFWAGESSRGTITLIRRSRGSPHGHQAPRRHRDRQGSAPYRIRLHTIGRH